MEYRFTRKHYCFWFVIYVAFVGVLESCLEGERLGLLSIKDYFKLNFGDEYESNGNEFFASWTDHPNADCCSWKRVECNNATAVTELSLDSLPLESTIGRQRVLNMSLFTPFKELLTLSLSDNDFTDCHQSYDFRALKNLVKLDLSFNNFSGNIQPCLSSLASLRSLYLRRSLWYNGNVSIPELGGLKKLEILDLSENQFSGNILYSLGNITSLKALSLASNNLNGSLAQQGLCELKNFRELDLSFNNLSETIPPCLGNWTSLRLLDLSSNRLQGDISSAPIFNLKDLKLIDLSENLFEGLFSFYSIANFTNLKVLKLSNLEVQTQYSRDWLPTFQLKVLVIQNCKFQNIPQFLAHQTDFRFLDLSHNNLSGTFPNWLLEKNTKLESLNLRNNSFTGQFHLSSNSSFVMGEIDISHNHLQGELQPDIGNLFSKVRELNLSKNAFEGRIPFSIGHMQELWILDLSNNSFSGEIVTTLVGLANFSNLEILVASNNKLHGQIPNSINVTSLRTLQLSGNQITGNLSAWISHYPRLGYLDISDNRITGEIPPSIGNLTSFGRISLNMAGNELEGRIPSELARLELYSLDLSYNSLLGPIPSCFNSSNLQHFNLEGNRLTGSIPETLLNTSDILTLNIGNNLLSGGIPSSIGALSNLRVLLLGRNSMRGLIPDQLCQLNKMGILDLSHNSFSGPIPRCFDGISFGKLTLSDFAHTSFRFGWDAGGYEKIGGNLLDSFSTFSYLLFESEEEVQVGFVTKTRRNIYKGSILDLMSGLDLSCNQLTGEIPAEFGSLSSIHSLNLSHNQLTGHIPTTLAKLGEIESLDLSHNKLGGKIPSELIGLNFLSYFSLAYNNLSGRLPDMDRQFQTFDTKSYEENPFLCGPPLASCIHDIPQLAPSNTDASEEKWYHIDPVSFFASFIASYLVFLVTFALVLYINPGWRWRLFMFIDNLMDECYFLIFYTVPKFFTALYR